MLIHFLSAGHQVASMSCVPHQSCSVTSPQIISQCATSCIYPYGPCELFFHLHVHLKKKKWPSQVVLVLKNLPVNAEDTGSISGSGKSPGGGNGNPLQYSCLENPSDRGALRATVDGVEKSPTQLSG